MKVLHISTYDTGGAGLCCLRIHQSLLEMGIDSKVLVLYKASNHSNVYSYGLWRSKLSKLPSKLLRMCGLKITEYNNLLELGKENNTSYSRPVSPIDLTKNELVDWADIIHLHWVNNFLDYSSFFRKIKKPIVWTLHDENLFYGIAHYSKGLLPNNKLEIKYKNIKREAILNACNLNIVFLSKHFYDQFGKESILSGKNITIINNAVDCEKFAIHDKKEMRKKYGLSIDKTIFLFMANVVSNPIKGLDVLSEALSELNLPNVQILAIGNNPQNQSWPLTQTYGMVKDEKILNELISVADYFAMPSYKEAFPQSPMEAMACGLPVVAFPVSGTFELINEKNGVVCEDFTKDSLKKGILKLFHTNYSQDIIRNSVLERFSPRAISSEYINLYSNLKKA